MNPALLGIITQTAPGHPNLLKAAGIGNIFYVDSNGGGSATSGGRHPDAAFTTIDAAVGACTANNGDIIVVMPNHAETVSAAGGLDLDVAGITIIGIGSGGNQPTVTLGTAATADVDIDAADITIENLHFVANVADINHIIDVNADDFTIRNCRFSQAGADLNAKICIQDAAAGGSDRITVEGCHAIMYDAANTHFINFAGTGTGHIIRGNVLLGDWGTAAIGGAGVITYCLIAENDIYNAASDTDSCINLAATATGIVHRNMVGNAEVQAAGITATACSINQNWHSVLSEDLSGVLEPATT